MQLDNNRPVRDGRRLTKKFPTFHSSIFFFFFCIASSFVNLEIFFVDQIIRIMAAKEYEYEKTLVRM